MISRRLSGAMRDSVHRHPVIAAALVVVAVRGIPKALGAFVSAAAAGLSGLLLTAALVLALRRHAWASVVGLNGPRRWKEWWLAWLPFAYAFLPLTNLLWRDVTGRVTSQLVTASVAYSAANAFVEEMLFRGLVLAILLSRFHATPGQVRGAVLGSAALFGLWHPPDDPHWEMNVAQWVYAAFGGVGFAGLSLRTRSLWLGMTAHTMLVMWNLIVANVTTAPSGSASLSQVRLDAALSVVIMLPWLCYGLFLIRKLEFRFEKGTAGKLEPVEWMAGAG